MNCSTRLLVILGARWLISLVLLSSLLSCSNSAQKNNVVSIRLSAATDLNPNINGRPSPLAVTIYQLANTSLFYKTDYVSLVENSAESLGRDLIKIHTLMLHPGQTVAVEYSVAEEEKAFAIVAGYRGIDVSKWQLVYEHPMKPPKLFSRFGGNRIYSHIVMADKNRIEFESSSIEH